MSEYFASRHDHILSCLADVKLLHLLVPAFAAVKIETAFFKTVSSNVSPQWKVTSVHSTCHCQKIREVMDRSAPISEKETEFEPFCTSTIIFFSFMSKNTFSFSLHLKGFKTVLKEDLREKQSWSFTFTAYPMPRACWNSETIHWTFPSSTSKWISNCPTVHKRCFNWTAAKQDLN